MPGFSFLSASALIFPRKHLTKRHVITYILVITVMQALTCLLCESKAGVKKTARSTMSLSFPESSKWDLVLPRPDAETAGHQMFLLFDISPYRGTLIFFLP